jgi:hypothetical protein
VHIGAWPPAITIASKRATSISDAVLVSSTSAASLAVAMKPMVIKSLEE